MTKIEAIQQFIDRDKSYGGPTCGGCRQYLDHLQQLLWDLQGVIEERDLYREALRNKTQLPGSFS